MSKIRFYLDENIRPVVEEQLKLLDINVVSARSLEVLGDADAAHLRRATEMNRVLCTHDTDFIILAESHLDHAGIIWAAHDKASIGGWVKALQQLHSEVSAEAMVGQVRYVNVK